MFCKRGGRGGSGSPGGEGDTRSTAESGKRGRGRGLYIFMSECARDSESKLPLSWNQLILNDRLAQRQGPGPALHAPARRLLRTPFPPVRSAFLPHRRPQRPLNVHQVRVSQKEDHHSRLSGALAQKHRSLAKFSHHRRRTVARRARTNRCLNARTPRVSSQTGG